jgi:hypothetical protein
MRYPVDDDFAIALSAKLYDLLARQGQSLPRTVAMTLQHLAGGAGDREFPALSMAAPALFGPAATDLKLPAPRRAAAPSFRRRARDGAAPGRRSLALGRGGRRWPWTVSAAAAR